LISAAAEVGWHGGDFAGFDRERGEAFVDSAAGADTLDDLLAEIAAFFEVDAMEQAGFLDEMPIKNLDAETRLTLFAADRFPGIEVSLRVFGQEAGARDGEGENEAQSVEAGLVEAGDVATLVGKDAVGFAGYRDGVGGG